MKINTFIRNNKKLSVRKWKEHPDNMPAFIYFICSEDGEIVYIGCTISPNDRISNHRSRTYFQNSSIFLFSDTLKKCRVMEKKLIGEIRPVCNVHWNPDTTGKRRYNIIKKQESNKRMKKEIVGEMKQKNISQTELARLMGVSRQRVSQIMTGDTGLHPDTLAKLEETLEIKLGKL